MGKNNKIFNDKIEDAIKNADFSEINKIISSTFSNAIDFAKDGVNKFQDYISNTDKKDYIPTKDHRLVDQKSSLETRANVYKVLGTIGFVSHGFIGLILLVFAMFKNTVPIVILLDWVLPVLVVSFFFYRHGIKLKEKSLRFKRYLRELGKSTVITVDELSSAVALDNDDVVDDLKEFIRKDYFKEARLIERDSIFILDNKTYQVYKNHTLEDEILIKEEKEKKVQEENKKEKNKYFYQLQDIEKNLQGNMKNKVSTLVLVVDKIFEFNERNPENAQSSYKFMEYYLPTTIKLLNSYVEFSRIEIKGENIQAAMSDIEHSMDTILSAFSKFLDNLYENSTIDIQTDISVLKTVLSQDGLLKNDFEKTK